MFSTRGRWLQPQRYYVLPTDWGRIFLPTGLVRRTMLPVTTYCGLGDYLVVEKLGPFRIESLTIVEEEIEY